MAKDLTWTQIELYYSFILYDFQDIALKIFT